MFFCPPPWSLVYLLNKSGTDGRTSPPPNTPNADVKNGYKQYIDLIYDNCVGRRRPNTYRNKKTEGKVSQ